MCGRSDSAQGGATARLRFHKEFIMARRSPPEFPFRREIGGKNRDARSSSHCIFIIFPDDCGPQPGNISAFDGNRKHRTGKYREITSQPIANGRHRNKENFSLTFLPSYLAIIIRLSSLMMLIGRFHQFSIGVRRTQPPIWAARADLYAIHDELDFIKAQITRLPTRTALARIALLCILGGAPLAVAGVELLAWLPR
jgi:hypothetical protein